MEDDVEVDGEVDDDGEDNGEDDVEDNNDGDMSYSGNLRIWISDLGLNSSWTFPLTCFLSSNYPYCPDFGYTCILSDY